VREATVVAIGILGVLAGCATMQEIGPPRLPQLEQAHQVMSGPGDRLSAYNTCIGASRTIDGLVECMRASGYDYIARSPDYPAAECWQLRDDPQYGGGRMPEQFCFVHQHKP